jgi:putative glycosyltransferase
MRPQISVVTSMYQSAAFLNEFHDRITKAVEQITSNFEVIYVDDGSPDNSQEIARAIITRDNRARVVVLSRNFGHFRATLTGIANAQGDLVYMTNCDLEEPPETVLAFHKLMTSDAAKPDLVYGWQKKRTARLVDRITGYFFYRLLNAFSGLNTPQNQIFSSLMKRNYADALLSYANEEHILLTGIMQLTGFTQRGMAVEKGFKGSSAYSLRRKIAVMVDAITSFSSKPLVAVSLMGLAMAVPAFLIVCYVVLRKLFFTDYMAGWASVIASIWFVGGMCIASVGIVGLYVGKIFIQVKQRPSVIIKEIVNRAPLQASGT